MKEHLFVIQRALYTMATNTPDALPPPTPVNILAQREADLATLRKQLLELETERRKLDNAVRAVDGSQLQIVRQMTNRLTTLQQPAASGSRDAAQALNIEIERGAETLRGLKRQSSELRQKYAQLNAQREQYREQFLRKYGS